MRNQNKIYVGNLPYTCTEADLTREFGTIGPVTESKLITDRETGRAKGFAFVTFADEDSVRRAVDELNGADFDGRQIRVSVAENRPRNAAPNFRTNRSQNGNY